MSNPIYSCCNEVRRGLVLNNPLLNGIDYLELADDSKIPSSPPQQTLLLYCLNSKPPDLTTVGASNVLIAGGESITGIVPDWVLLASSATAPPDTATSTELAYFNSLTNADKILVIRTSVAGDFSPYTLRLVNGVAAALQDSFEVTETLDGFDPQLTEVTFSFKIDCPPYFDCKPKTPNCPPDLPTPPPINYLAKDYGSFRTILLDRLNQLLPAWNATSEADMGVVLAELIAYAGDQLSYHQDAVATEAYLLTARSRISLRRHALLVDYRVHDGANARAFVHLEVNNPVTLDPASARFYTYAPNMPSTLAPGQGNEQAALDAGVVAFEPMQGADLFPEHNELQFYTWGDGNCCLPKGATEATLKGTYDKLQVGDILIFQEVLGPQTGVAADADIRHRYAVRLTSVATQNAAGKLLVDPLFNTSGAEITTAGQDAQPVTEIQWASDDALPAPLCLSSTFADQNGATTTLTNVSVVYGNVVLADQGLSMPAAPLPQVPEPKLFVPGSATADRCNPTAPAPLPVRYRPQMPQSPVTQAVPLPLAGSPVTSNAVPLASTAWVTLADSNGYACLMVQPDSPLQWPQYFAVEVSVNTGTPATFNLSVIYDPVGAPPGSQMALETFPNLTLTANVSNSVDKQINGVSRFITVTPLVNATPTSLPTVPVSLPNTGTVTLSDSGSNAYLKVQPTPALSWPPNFAVLAQGDIGDPTEFNLLLLFEPVDGGVGVQTPIVVEQFTGLTLNTSESAFSAGSTLLNVLTFEGEPNPSLSAFDLMHYDASEAVPVITLSGIVDGETSTWNAAPDLLASGPDDTNFVVEVEYTGAATLRFGDDTNGMRPLSGTQFTASYRIGNGTAGNVGADSLTYFAGPAQIQSCTNPLPASGGVDPETMAQIRRRAPQAFETQERAITMPDYVRVTEQNPQVEDAYAMLRWTGSWYTVFITAEPQTGGSLSSTLRKALTRNVNWYRLAGQDIQLEGPDYVSLEIKLLVCVDSEYFQSDVEEGLMEVLGSGTLPSGQPAAFAPGAFKLGQTVYLSPIYAAARTVAGVQSVTAKVFQPQGQPRTRVYVENGEIPMGPFQVARMDNDPSLPANGQLTIVLQGGK